MTKEPTVTETGLAEDAAMAHELTRRVVGAPTDHGTRRADLMITALGAAITKILGLKYPDCWEDELDRLTRSIKSALNVRTTERQRIEGYLEYGRALKFTDDEIWAFIEARAP
jgi:hypothetical protein